MRLRRCVMEGGGYVIRGEWGIGVFVLIIFLVEEDF